MVFKCELIHNGVIKENFFRQGQTIEDVKNGLESFDFGEGVWRISLVEDWQDE